MRNSLRALTIPALQALARKKRIAFKVKARKDDLIVSLLAGDA